MLDEDQGILARGRLASKVALVTGAAKGLGEAIARLFAREGAIVFVADIDGNGAAAVANAIEAIGASAVPWEMDVALEHAWDEATRVVLDRQGRLDILVNNAGIGTEGDMEMSFELWRKIISVNLDSVFLGTRAAIRAMRQCGNRGSIINMSSTMGFVAQANTAAYSASKGGVRSLTKAAALHCSRHRLPIRVNSLHPGTCFTPLMREFAVTHPRVFEEQLALHPIGRLGEPLDVAYGALYLASDESCFSTGSELVIDGGFLAQ